MKNSKFTYNSTSIHLLIVFYYYVLFSAIGVDCGRIVTTNDAYASYEKSTMSPKSTTAVFHHINTRRSTTAVNQRPTMPTKFDGNLSKMSATSANTKGGNLSATSPIMKTGNMSATTSTYLSATSAPTKITTTAKANVTKKKREPKPKLLVFCKICSHQKWTKVQMFVRNYLKYAKPEDKPIVTINRNYTLAEKVYGLKNYPSFVYVRHNKTEKYDKKWPLDFADLKDWLISKEKLKTQTIIDLNATTFNDILTESYHNELIWVILLIRKPTENDGDLNGHLLRNENSPIGSATSSRILSDLEKAYTLKHDRTLRYVQRYFRSEAPLVEVAKFEVNEDDNIIVKHRLAINVHEEICPVLVIVRHGLFHNVYYDCTVDSSDEKLKRQIKDVISHQKDPPVVGIYWQQIDGELSDLEFTYESLRQKSLHHKTNKKFVMIGVSGGVAVVALAISIFWGLKSSS